MNQPQDNDVILRDADGDWLYFHNPRTVLCAWTLDEVLPVLREAASRNGWAAGYVSYEAAPAFDSALPARTGRCPLLWFGIYDQPEKISIPSMESGGSVWTPDCPESEYFKQIHQIKNHIAAGESYQVNYTIRMCSRLVNPWQLFLSHMAASRFSGYIQTRELAICSASPELFFELDGNSITCCPMKGTGRTAESLSESSKDRAENIMIVDMIRNDLGRICEPGTIIAEPLHAIEPVADLWQMTSTVKGRTAADILTVFQALFPCASITGAPKRRTMQIIQELESSPRGVYCGAIGYMAPGRKARFSVAIRTAVVDQTTGDAVYGVGGGIVWDSQPEAEWAECALKAEILTAVGAVSSANTGGRTGDQQLSGAPIQISPDFQLLETMLYSNGIVYLREHIQRLTDSAAKLGFRLDRAELHQRLASVSGPRQRLRLLLSRDGTIRFEAYPFAAQEEPLRRIAFALEPVDSETLWLYHKTTHRELYNQASSSQPDADDVILWNTCGEVTECTIANIVARINGVMVTPPIDCGLLPGTMRAALLEEKMIQERVITCADLIQAEELFLINSLRGWMPAKIITCQIRRTF